MRTLKYISTLIIGFSISAFANNQNNNVNTIRNKNCAYKIQENMLNYDKYSEVEPKIKITLVNKGWTYDPNSELTLEVTEAGGEGKALGGSRDSEFSDESMNTFRVNLAIVDSKYETMTEGLGQSSKNEVEQENSSIIQRGLIRAVDNIAECVKN